MNSLGKMKRFDPTLWLYVQQESIFDLRISSLIPVSFRIHQKADESSVMSDISLSHSTVFSFSIYSASARSLTAHERIYTSEFVKDG